MILPKIQNRCVRIWSARFAVLLTAGLIQVFPCLAYEDAEHTDIATQARENYIDYVHGHTSTSVGLNAIGVHSPSFLWGAVQEDYEGNVPYREHFYDPMTGFGLERPLGAGHFKDAVTRANEYWRNEVLPSYRDGHYGNAYRYLGRVAHLVSDMGVPAHVNLDYHGGPNSGGYDYYEHTYINGHHIPTTTIASGASVTAIMVAIAMPSRGFDSGSAVNGEGVNGITDAGVRGANGFTDPECVQISSVCYPNAQAGVGGLLKLFYDTVKPTVSLTKPANGQLCSGIKGVSLAAKAHSYDKQFIDVDFIAKVSYQFELMPHVEDHWDNAAEAESLGATGEYEAIWSNGINSNQVLIRAQAVDQGACESLPEAVMISIDSKRPEVKNTKP